MGLFDWLFGGKEEEAGPQFQAEKEYLEEHPPPDDYLKDVKWPKQPECGPLDTTCPMILPNINDMWEAAEAIEDPEDRKAAMTDLYMNFGLPASDFDVNLGNKKVWLKKDKEE